MIEVYSVYAVLVDSTICCIIINSKLKVAFLMALSIETLTYGMVVSRVTTRNNRKRVHNNRYI